MVLSSFFFSIPIRNILIGGPLYSDFLSDTGHNFIPTSNGPNTHACIGSFAVSEVLLYQGTLLYQGVFTLLTGFSAAQKREPLRKIYRVLSLPFPSWLSFMSYLLLSGIFCYLAKNPLIFYRLFLSCPGKYLFLSFSDDFVKKCLVKFSYFFQFAFQTLC